MDELEKSVEAYWTQRASDFNTVRLNELRDPISGRWLREMGRRLPERKPLRILDVGTGTGYFAILLTQAGHELTGIDLTPAMWRRRRRPPPGSASGSISAGWTPRGRTSLKRASTQ